MDHSEPKKKLQTDVSRRAALPTGSLFNRNQQQTEVAVNSETYLANIEEEWNKKIDAEVEVLVDGMVDLVEIASIKDKDKYRMQKEAFQTEARAESMVLAASHLLSITHSIKLLLLLSDEKEIVTQRDAELKHLEEEISETRKLAIQRSEELLR